MPDISSETALSRSEIDRVERPRYTRYSTLRKCRHYVWCNPSFVDNRRHLWTVEIPDPPEYSRFEIWDRTPIAPHLSLTKDQLLSTGAVHDSHIFILDELSDTLEPYVGPLESPRISIHGLEDSVILADDDSPIAAFVEASFNLRPGVWEDLNASDVIWNSSIDGQLSGIAQVLLRAQDLSLGKHEIAIIAYGPRGQVARANVTVIRIDSRAGMAPLDDEYTIVLSDTVILDVLANDRTSEDVDIYQRELRIATDPELGTVHVVRTEGKQQIEYTALGHPGTDEFDYEACDTELDQCVEGHVSISVLCETIDSCPTKPTDP